MLFNKCNTRVFINRLNCVALTYEHTNTIYEICIPKSIIECMRIKFPHKWQNNPSWCALASKGNVCFSGCAYNEWQFN